MKRCQNRGFTDFWNVLKRTENIGIWSVQEWAALRKETEKKMEQQEKQECSFKKGWWRKRETRDGILKGETKEKEEECQEEKKMNLKKGFLGNTREKKTLKLQEKGLLGFLPPKQTETKKTKPKPPKNTNKRRVKNTLFILNNNPLFLVSFPLPCSLHLFSAILCFAENTIKTVVSAKHSFYVSQRETPLFDTISCSEGGVHFLEATKLAILLIFVGFGAFLKTQNAGHGQNSYVYRKSLF